jgi:hypothetical protein
MARYLVVAHQTAESAELRNALRLIHDGDPSATFVLLVPATPVEHLAGWVEGESRMYAQQIGDRARLAFEEDGLNIEDVLVGDPNPTYAVSDESAERAYEGVIVATLPPALSRWLKLDVVSRIRRQVGVPVTHVSATVGASNK